MLVDMPVRSAVISALVCFAVTGCAGALPTQTIHTPNTGSFADSIDRDRTEIGARCRGLIFLLRLAALKQILSAYAGDPGSTTRP
jgi:hypothetical protein